MAMTFTIHVPIFPMRKEIAERRARKASAALDASSRARPRDIEGYLELELLPLDELDSLETATSKARRRARQS
jgi:hypothetical protein